MAKSSIKFETAEQSITIVGSIDRRQVLASAGAGMLLSAILPLSARAATSSQVGNKSWAGSLSVADAAGGIRSGEFTVEKYVGALIERANRLTSLNVFISKDDGALLESAREVDRQRAKGAVLGPLAGVPLIVKDNIETRSLTTSAGTIGLRDNHPQRDAAVLASLTSGGALLFGKSNMDELAFGVSSNNQAFGPVHNPYAPDRIAGGSSGGTAAGIAAQIAPAGLGTDTGGSVRIPASLCGIVGFRPSSGRYPRGGAVPFSSTRDEIGPLARTVTDIALMDSLIVGEPMPAVGNLAGIRIGLPKRYFWADLDPETESLMNGAVRRMTDLGIIFQEVDLPGIDALIDAVAPVLGYEMTRTIGDYLVATGSPLSVAQLFALVRSPDVRALYDGVVGAKISNAAYVEALDRTRPRLQVIFDDCFRQNGLSALLFPATPYPATPIGQEVVKLNNADSSVHVAFFHNANPGSAIGMPGLVMPAGMTSAGLPVGMELDGRAGSDRLLLSLGRALEKHFPVSPPRIAA